MIRWGITDIVGDGFVQPSVLRSMNGKGEVVQQTDLLKVGRDYGFPVSVNAFSPEHVVADREPSGMQSTAQISTPVWSKARSGTE